MDLQDSWWKVVKRCSQPASKVFMIPTGQLQRWSSDVCSQHHRWFVSRGKSSSADGFARYLAKGDQEVFAASITGIWDSPWRCWAQSMCPLFTKRGIRPNLSPLCRWRGMESPQTVPPITHTYFWNSQLHHWFQSACQTRWFRGAWTRWTRLTNSNSWRHIRERQFHHSWQEARIKEIKVIEWRSHPTIPYL